jgi:glycosyltransferase involved in cell wall biosynthesis
LTPLANARDISVERSSVVILSSIDWGFLWQGHQEIASRFAAAGHRVLFVENSGVRAPRLGDVGRVRRRLANWWRARRSRGIAEVQPGLFVLSPLLLPLPYSRAALGLNVAVLKAAIGRWLSPGERPLLWTFLPTPLALEMRRVLHPGTTIYYCVDDFASSSAAARRITSSEESMLGAADLVFVTSRRLRERALRFSDRVGLFPFGVDLKSFERALDDPGEPPSVLRDLPHPLLGYVGGIHRWVDAGLLAAVADRLPHATLLMIGPLQTDVAKLLRRPNVRWLGQQPHAELPGLLKHIDVGLIPYLRCEYTDHVHPTKLSEYLALGLPVVATALPELRGVNEEHPGLLHLADDVEGFLRGIAAALAPAPAAERQRRLAVARQSAWSERFAAMTRALEHRLAPRGR